MCTLSGSAAKRHINRCSHLSQIFFISNSFYSNLNVLLETSFILVLSNIPLTLTEGHPHTGCQCSSGSLPAYNESRGCVHHIPDQDLHLFFTSMYNECGTCLYPQLTLQINDALQLPAVLIYTRLALQTEAVYLYFCYLNMG